MSRIALSAMHAELNVGSRAGAVVRALAPTDVARVRFWATLMWARFVIGFLVSKETVVLRRWGRSKQ